MDTGIERMNVLVNEIVGFVLGPAQDMEIGEVERGLLKLVMRVGREGLVCYLEEKGTGRQEYRIFGPIEIKRAYDRESRSISAGQRDKSSREGVFLSYSRRFLQNLR